MSSKDQGTYTPPQDDLGMYDVHSENDGDRGPLLLVVAIALLMAFAAVVYTAYHEGVREGGRAAAPHISAPAGPAKKRPADPEGVPTPNLNSKAYEPLDGVDDASKPVITTPPAEQPLAPIIEKPLAEAVVKKPVSTPVEKPAPMPVEKAKPVVKEPVKKIQPVSRKPVSLPAAGTTGAFVVQIASFRSEDKAKDGWRALVRRLPTQMKGHAADIQRADLGERGVYYRLRVAAFADRPKATTFCNAIKAKGQDCLVVKR